jgi:hypothetical protein
MDRESHALLSGRAGKTRRWGDKDMKQDRTTQIDSFFDDNQLTSYHCCSEWHLARMSPACSLVYPFALHISKESRKFSCSARGVAEFFGRNEKTVQRAYRELVEGGFFVLLQKGQFESSIYEVLTHKEWSERNPGQCTHKTEYPWTGEGDPLGRRLYAASGGRIKFMPFQVEAYRKTGFSEDEIVSFFEKFLSAAAYHYPSNRKWAGLDFLMFLREISRRKCSGVGRAHPTVERAECAPVVATV